MAASIVAHGYQYQFIDSISEDFYCKQCGLVAREIVIASCCGESYCKGCIQAVKQDSKPCPGCGEESFEFMSHVKYQRKISALNIYCSLKERGCGWSGPLASLDAHLHPDTGDCEYTDVDCPLKCGQKVSKKTLEHHTAKECVHRNYICPYCAFKATYRIVTEIHWPECTYFPLACPNRCGVTCERPTMEDHMKICPLEEVACQFEHVGCSGKFRREEEEQHMREKSQAHLVMTATAYKQMKQDFQSKLQEQETKFNRKYEEQERKIEEQERKFKEQKEQQERKIKEQEKKTEQQQQNFVRQTKELEEKLREARVELNQLKRNTQFEFSVCRLQPPYRFIMENFSTEKAKDKPGEWKSPPMYTHLCGYKFCIGVYANGWGNYTRGNSLWVEAWRLPGEYDSRLKWPAKVEFTFELINHFKGGENKRVVQTMTWGKPASVIRLLPPFTSDPQCDGRFVKHSELAANPQQKTEFLVNDTLHFTITTIRVRS